MPSIQHALLTTLMFGALLQTFALVGHDNAETAGDTSASQSSGTRIDSQLPAASPPSVGPSTTLADDLASLIINDAAYESSMRSFAEGLMAELVASKPGRPLRNAIRNDEQKVSVALVETVSILIPKPVFRRAYAQALIRQFSPAEMVEILAFGRSRAGQRYFSLLGDAGFKTTLFSFFPNVDDTQLTTVLLGQLHRQFPSLGFDKRVPR